MVKVQHCRDIDIEFLPTVPHLETALEQHIDTIWATAPSTLIDDLISVVHTWDGERLTLAACPYKVYYASCQDKTIGAALPLYAFAVTGWITSSEGVLIGLRSPSVTQYPHHWESAPSGSVSTDHAISPETQFFQELAEECNLHAQDLTTPKHQAIVLDDTARTLDLILAAETTVTAAALQPSSSGEYERLQFLPLSNHQCFCEQQAATPILTALLKAAIAGAAL